MSELVIRQFKLKYFFAIFFAIVLSAMLSTASFAADKTWDGGGAGDTFMSTAANWDADTLPAAGDRLIFDNTSSNAAIWDVGFVGAQNFELLIDGSYVGTGITISTTTLTITSTTIASAAASLDIDVNSLTIAGDLTIAGGVVTSTDSAGTLNILGNFSIVAGSTFHAPAITSITGNWMFYGGVLINTPSHVWELTFNNTLASQSFDTGGGMVVYNAIVINNTEGGTSDSVVIMQDLVTNGNVTITQGLLDLATSNTMLDIGPFVVGVTDSNLTLADNAQAGWTWGSQGQTVSGNITINDAATMTAGSGVLTLDGQAGGQMIDLDGQALNGLIINTGLPGGAIITGTLDVDMNDVTVTQGTLDFFSNNGILDLEANMLVDDNADAIWTWGAGAQNITGNLEQYGSGVITPGGGILTFDASTGNQNVSSSATFDLITINNTTADGTVFVVYDTGVSNMTVTSLTITDGVLDLATNSTAIDVIANIQIDGAGGGLIWGSNVGDWAVSVGGDFLYEAAGTVVHGMSPIQFDAAGAATSTIVIASGLLDLGEVTADGNLKLTGVTNLKVSTTTVASGKNLRLASASTLTIDGIGASLVLTGELIAASDSTVEFIGTGEDATTIPAATYGALTLNGTSQTFNAGGNITTAGDMTLTDGTFNGAGTMTVGEDITVEGGTFNGAGTIAITGDMDIDGGIFAAGTGIITLSGDLSNSGGLITEASTGYIISATNRTDFIDGAGTQQTTITYKDNDIIRVLVYDDDENLDASAYDTVQVTITNQLGDREVFTLPEYLVPVSASFVGGFRVKLSEGAIKGNGVLEVNGDLLATVSYGDVEDSSDTKVGTVYLKGPGVTTQHVYPDAPVLVVDKGLEEVYGRDVLLDVEYGDDVEEIIISEDPTFVKDTWVPAKTRFDFELSDGFGEKTIYAQVRNLNNNLSSISSVTVNYLDENAPDDKDDDAGSSDGGASDSGSDNGGVAPPVFTGKLYKDITEIERADLIKSISNTAVYYYGIDGKRHPFAHHNVFFTWFDNFEDVKTVSDDLLASIPMGTAMTTRPGTKLIKLRTDPKVYAVGTGSTLHWLADAKIAEDLYGKNWEDRIVDISDLMYGTYTRLDDITTWKYPNGSVVTFSGKDYFVENNLWRMFGSSGLKLNNIPSSAIIAAPIYIEFETGLPVFLREEFVKFPTSFR